jgi:hypothetical protein
MNLLRSCCHAAVLAALTTVGVAATAVEPRLGVLPPDPGAPPAAPLDAAPGGLRPGSDPFSLLTSPEVQADLGLSEAQLDSLRRANPLFRSQVQRVAHADGPGAEARFERLLWTSRGAIANILTPQQQQRFREILIQVGGPCLIPEDPQLRRTLGIGETLEGRIAAACGAVAADLQAEFRAPPPGEDPCPTLLENKRRLEALRRDGERGVVALLSGEQQQTYAALQGAEITISPRPIDACAGSSADEFGAGTRTEK